MLERTLSTLSTASTMLQSSRGTIVDDGGFSIERDDENDRVTTYNPCRSFAPTHSCLGLYRSRFNKREQMRLRPIFCNNDRLYALAKRANVHETRNGMGRPLVCATQSCTSLAKRTSGASCGRYLSRETCDRGANFVVTRINELRPPPLSRRRFEIRKVCSA